MGFSLLMFWWWKKYKILGVEFVCFKTIGQYDPAVFCIKYFHGVPEEWDWDFLGIHTLYEYIKDKRRS